MIAATQMLPVPPGFEAKNVRPVVEQPSVEGCCLSKEAKSRKPAREIYKPPISRKCRDLNNDGKTSQIYGNINTVQDSIVKIDQPSIAKERTKSSCENEATDRKSEKEKPSRNKPRNHRSAVSRRNGAVDIVQKPSQPSEEIHQEIARDQASVIETKGREKDIPPRTEEGNPVREKVRRKRNRRKKKPVPELSNREEVQKDPPKSDVGKTEEQQNPEPNSIPKIRLKYFGKWNNRKRRPSKRGVAEESGASTTNGNDSELVEKPEEGVDSNLMESELSEEVESELIALEAMFPDAVEILPCKPRTRIRVFCATDVHVNILLTPDYPRSSPNFEVCAPFITAELKSKFASELHGVLAENPGELVLHSLTECTIEFAQQLLAENGAEGTENSETSGSESSDEETGQSPAPAPAAIYPIFSGEFLEDRRSIFQAHVAEISSKEDVAGVLAQLKLNNKIARATHNIVAWRLIVQTANGKSLEQHDCVDDGEFGAGPKLSRLLVMMGAINVVVVVTRWYGGCNLGPDRFRHICNVARDALIKSNVVRTN